jgi:hypothetical protein
LSSLPSRRRNARRRSGSRISAAASRADSPIGQTQPECISEPAP